jgi:hypothetical protein
MNEPIILGTYETRPLYCAVTGYEDTLTIGGICPLCKQDVMDTDSDAFYDHVIGGEA